MSREPAKARLEKIADVIRHAETRAMATDGPVSKTTDVITEDELRRIYELAAGTPPWDGEPNLPHPDDTAEIGGEETPTWWFLRGFRGTLFRIEDTLKAMHACLDDIRHVVTEEGPDG